MSREPDEWWQYEPVIGRTVPTTLPCPPWCALDPGHPFETTDPDENPLRAVTSDPPPSRPGRPAAPLLRIHRRRFGARPTHVTVETYERSAVGSASSSDLGTDPTATLVRLQLPTGHGHVTPDGARRLAALLLAAADVAASEVTP